MAFGLGAPAALTSATPGFIETPADTADPYTIAAIAVAGTVLGAAVAALTQLMIARSTQANQKKVLDAQLGHQAAMQLRSDRREAYVTLLRTLDRAQALTGTCYQARQNHKEAQEQEEAANPEARDVRPPGLPPREEVDAMNVEMLADLRMVDLLGRAEIVDMTARLVHSEIARLWATWRGNEISWHTPAGVTYFSVINAMQADLGVEGGHTIDPKSGRVNRERAEEATVEDGRT